MERVFNKLVRDKIPEKIKNNGEKAITRVLTLEEYKDELFKKLDEEKFEIINATTTDELTEELADIYEVLEAIANVFEIDPKNIDKVKLEKNLSRGGFEKRIYLEKTISK